MAVDPENLTWNGHAAILRPVMESLLTAALALLKAPNGEEVDEEVELSQDDVDDSLTYLSDAWDRIVGGVIEIDDGEDLIAEGSFAGSLVDRAMDIWMGNATLQGQLDSMLPTTKATGGRP
jgi:hypothetical protein